MLSPFCQITVRSRSSVAAAICLLPSPMRRPEGGVASFYFRFEDGRIPSRRAIGSTGYPSVILGRFVGLPAQRAAGMWCLSGHWYGREFCSFDQT